MLAAHRLLWWRHRHETFYRGFCRAICPPPRLHHPAFFKPTEVPMAAARRPRLNLSGKWIGGSAGRATCGLTRRRTTAADGLLNIVLSMRLATIITAKRDRGVGGAWAQKGNPSAPLRTRASSPHAILYASSITTEVKIIQIRARSRCSHYSPVGIRLGEQTSARCPGPRPPSWVRRSTARWGYARSRVASVKHGEGACGNLWDFTPTTPKRDGFPFANLHCRIDGRFPDVRLFLHVWRESTAGDGAQSKSLSG